MLVTSSNNQIFAVLTQNDIIFQNDNGIVFIPSSVGMERGISDVDDDMLENDYINDLPLPQIMIKNKLDANYLKWVKNKGLGFGISSTWIC